ncbi:DUF2125 domain-containing protein [Pseudaestuariivita atlantica]|uniref:DUF2125 domain-containing protein n=1 Tax=Pseudaestuariivita atlantica TaxID=1317121 RepID=A0A0L1JPA5_9RHOB|nr:DUF2125 domain-containing protein [Pseudaestuariivita atlantica]KNG93594.1 hypothetical protein ATO11_10300 [Pseudaestuariivita atlantica]
MTRIFTLGSSTALASVLLAAPAFAELTAAQVWADQKAYLAGFGYTVSASETQSGDTLEISDYTVVVPVPEEGVEVTMMLPDMSLTTQSDGSVAIGLGRDLPIVMDVTAEGEDPVRIELGVTNSKFDIVASGSPNDMTYTYDADDIAIALESLTVEGANAVPGIIDFKLSMSQFDGVSAVQVGDLRNMQQSLSLGDMSYSVKIDEPGSEEGGTFAGNVAGISFEGDMRLPLEIDPTDPAAFFGGGFLVDGTYSAGPGNTNFNFTADGETLVGALSSTSSTLSVSIDDGVVGYGLTGTDNTVALQGTDLPFPVEFAMEETRFEIGVPLAKSDEEQGFGLGVTFGKFTMGDLLWSIFDPAGQLPRDPATIDLDLVGGVKLLVDLFDEDAMQAVERGEMLPGELQSLTLQNLLIEAVGAKLTGSGDFTFDNTDMQTYDGIPKPIGAVDLQLAGANALIDTLINMGLLPQEQAMGARMMMSMFAVPAGDDVLKSRIEMNEQGQILANGQRIR